MSKFNGTGKSPSSKPNGIGGGDMNQQCSQKCRQYCNHVGKRTEDSAQAALDVCDRATNCDSATNCNKRTNC